MARRRVGVGGFGAILIFSGIARGQIVRDSAGVRIVDNPPRLGARVAFALGPKLLEVGGLESDPGNEFEPYRQAYQLAVRVSGGGVMVTDVTRIHVFDRAGKRIGMIGRKGSGPGEFLQTATICRTRGDTIVVDDYHNHRFAVIDAATRRVVRSIPLGDVRTGVSISCFDDGTLLARVSIPTPPGQPRRVRLSRLRLDGSVVRELGEREFAGNLLLNSAPIFFAAGQSVVFAPAMTNEVHVLDGSGKPRIIVRSTDRPIPVASADVEKLMSAIIPPNAPATTENSAIRAMRMTDPHDHWPFHGNVEVDPLGRIWIEDYAKPGDRPSGWTAFDSTGRIMGRLLVPAPSHKESPSGKRVVAFGSDDVSIRWADADGAMRLTVYRLVRR